MQVRQAVAADADWILRQLKAFSAFFGTKLQLFDDASTPAALSDMIERHPFLVAIGETQTRAEYLGFIAGFMLPHPFNPKIIVLNEALWWVAPEHRGTGAGAALLLEWIKLGRTHGADWITMVLEQQSPVKPESLERLGFRLHERAFLLEVA